MYNRASNHSQPWGLHESILIAHEPPISKQIAHLLNSRITKCSVTRDENTVVRITTIRTYVDVAPRPNTQHLVGWTIGNSKNPGRFFEVERTLGSRNGNTEMIENIGSPSSVWNVNCVADTNAYHINDAGQAHKVLRIIDINGYPIDRLMPYWLPITHSLGRKSRGDAWRMPVLYLTMRRKTSERALGAHIPLSSKMLTNPSIQKLFEDKGSSETVQCIFDMSNLHVEKVRKDYEYLVASGTLATGNAMSLPLVIGVYNAGLADEN